MWIVFGFSAMGLLLGSLVGLSSESLAKSIIILLFAFVGGSAFAFLHKLSATDRRLAGQMLSSLCIFFLVGLFSGIYINSHRTLSPNPQLAQQSYAYRDDSYVRNAAVALAHEIDLRKSTGLITAEQAYDQMYKLAIAQTQPEKGK